MKKCELCDSPAKMYCESDQASLCWDCDSRVHGVNFLVAKHTRTLLCHVCQSPTPWNGSGPKLGPSTISVCNICVGDSCYREKGNSRGSCIDDEDDLEGEDEDNDDDDDVGDEDDDDEENQVVPWSSTPPPPVSSSSTSEECSSKFSNGEEGTSESNLRFSMKHMRETAKFRSQMI